MYNLINEHHEEIRTSEPSIADVCHENLIHYWNLRPICHMPTSSTTGKTGTDCENRKMELKYCFKVYLHINVLSHINALSYYICEIIIFTMSVFQTSVFQFK